MKKYTIILSIFLLYVVLSGCDYSNKPKGIKELKEMNGLVGYWKFDGTAKDSSGNNNHGKWMGKEIYSEGGVFGKAAYFDGVSNYVVVSHSPSIDVGKGVFSFGAWVYSVGKKKDKNQHFLNKRVGGKGIFWNMYLSGKVENINAELATGSLGNPQSNMKINTWHHTLLARDISGLTTVYIDGKPILRKSMSGDSSNTHSFCIGNLVEDLNQGFNGLIDEVVVYNRALKKEEVEKLYGWDRK